MKNQNTIPFPDELENLNHTLETIDTALEKARKDVFRLDQEYKEAKRYMADYRNEMYSHEKLQNEQLLDQTDRTGVFAVQTCKKLGVPDADNKNYISDYDRNLLYIACTRAMHELTIFYTGEPSPFLP